MILRLWFIACVIFLPVAAPAQDLYQPPGAVVVASPLSLPDMWEECTVIAPIPEAGAYRLSCRTGEFIVGIGNVLPWTPENARLAAPPSARPGAPKLGDRVLASPLGLNDRWESCTVALDLSFLNAYEVDCAGARYVVSRDWVKPDQGAAGAAPQAPAPQPAATRDEFQPGDFVEASPERGLWGVGVVIARNPKGYQVRLLPTDAYPAAPLAIVPASGVRQIGAAAPEPAPAPAIAIAPAPAPAAPAPAPALAPAPAPAPAAPAAPAPPAPAPPAPAPAAPALAAAAGQTAIPDGIYLAPVGGSIEVLQISGGLVALNPMVLLGPGDFAAANAALVGTLEIAGDQLTIAWQGHDTYSGRFTFDGSCIGWGYLYCRATPFEPGTQLDGRYVGSATAGGGVVSRTLRASTWWQCRTIGRDRQGRPCGGRPARQSARRGHCIRNTGWRCARSMRHRARSTASPRHGRANGCRFGLVAPGSRFLQWRTGRERRCGSNSTCARRGCRPIRRSMR